MGRERLLADGFEITAGRNGFLDVETWDGQFGVAGPIVNTVDVPGRDGQIVGDMALPPATMSVAVWVGGPDRASALAKWERLLRAVRKGRTLTRWERTWPDGTTREAYGYLSGRISPSQVGPKTWRAVIEVSIPSGTWQDTVDLDTGGILLDSTLAGSVNKLVPLTQFAGASAPMTTLTISVKGTITGMVLTDPVTGDWAKYPSLGGSDVLTLDCASDTVSAPNIDKLTYSGAYFMQVQPADDGSAPALRITGTGTGAGTWLRVQGRRQYAV